jgi:sec-independent protein translocase protein TatA
MTSHMLALGMPGVTEMIIIGALGLLIFGKRLPEVGRSLGKGIVEFKKGLKGIDEDVSMVDDQIDNSSTRRSLTHEERKTTTAASPAPDHKFDPYTGKPIPAAKFDPYTGKPIDETAKDSADEHSPSSTV